VWPVPWKSEEGWVVLVRCLLLSRIKRGWCSDAMPMVFTPCLLGLSPSLNPWVYNYSPPFPCLTGGRARTGGRDFVYADSSKSARVK